MKAGTRTAASIVFPLLVLTGWGLPARALDIEEAMERAATNTEAAEILRLQVGVAEAREQTALGGLLPLLSVSGSVVRNSEEVGIGESSVVDLYEGSATARLSADLFRGAAIPAYTAAGDGVVAAEAWARWERAGLRLAAGRAYLTALNAKQNAEAANASLSVREASHRQTELLLEAGYALPADLSRAQLSVLDAETAVVDAELAFQDALDQLAFLVGVADLTGDDLEPVDTSVLFGDAATDRRADLRALDAELAAQTALETGEWLSFLPSLSLTGQYNVGPESFRAPDGVSWSIELTASWLLFDFARYGRLHQTEAQVAVDAERVAEAERLFDTELSRAQRRLSAAETRVEVAQQAMRVAEEIQALEADLYARGERTALEMVQADEARFGAQVDLNLAHLERDLARLEVVYLCGGLEAE